MKILRWKGLEGSPSKTCPKLDLISKTCPKLGLISKTCPKLTEEMTHAVKSEPQSGYEN